MASQTFSVDWDESAVSSHLERSWSHSSWSAHAERWGRSGGRSLVRCSWPSSPAAGSVLRTAPCWGSPASSWWGFLRGEREPDSFTWMQRSSVNQSQWTTTEALDFLTSLWTSMFHSGVILSPVFIPLLLIPGISQTTSGLCPHFPGDLKTAARPLRCYNTDFFWQDDSWLDSCVLSLSGLSFVFWSSNVQSHVRSDPDCSFSADHIFYHLTFWVDNDDPLNSLLALDPLQSFLYFSLENNNTDELASCHWTLAAAVTDGPEIATDIREKCENSNKTIRLAAVKLEEANVRYTELTDNARLAYVSWTVSIFFLILCTLLTFTVRTELWSC